MEDQIAVLVIDDDEVDRLTLRRALKKSEINFIMTETQSAVEALDLLKTNRYDCVFLDYLLPGTDGLAVLRSIRSEGIKTPIVIVTSQGDEAVAVEMMKSGASDYVVKNNIDALNIKKVIQGVTQLREIEKRREAAEEALKVSEFRLSEAQKIAKIGNWEYDFKTHQVYWSEEMYRILEVDPAEFVPRREHFLTLFHPDDGPLINSNFNLEEDSRVPFNKDLRIKRSDGTYKYVNLQTYFQYDEEGVLEKFVGTVQDIDQRKKIEQELFEAKKLAEESGKIKEQFLANMSHEIRTPMNAIIGFTKLLLDSSVNLTREQKNSIKAIHDAGEHLMVIINDILDFSKIESGKLPLEKLDFSLVELISSVENLFQTKALEKGIEFSCTIDESVPSFLTGDPVRLNQILVNLIGNSIKFTEKGFVKLKVRTLNRTDPNITVRFEVEDTGIGIPQNKIGLIFESFTQASSDTTRKYGGTGLGLTIVKKIIEIQKGEISINSEEGRGTVFTVDLPFEINVSDNLKERFENLKEEPVRTDYPRDIKVLMAEDNELNQVLSKSIFDKIGWDLDIAENGLMVIEKLKQSRYDVVLMDIQMPEMDGYQTTMKIRREMEPPLSDIPIIAITAHVLSSEVEKCLTSGMNDYISKPFKVGDLINKVCQHVKKDRLLANKNGNIVESQASDSANFTNLKNLYEMTGNSPETIRSIVNLFLDKTPEQLQELQTLLQAKNWNGLQLACHKLKSSYAIFGAVEVKGYLEVIEESCSGKDVDSSKIEELMVSVMELNPKVMDELRSVVSA